MADAVVSLVAERMIALLEEQATYHINLVRGAEKEVGNLAQELKTVRNVLDDAERRGYKEKSIKDWLSRLEQTSYEMEDVLDEWNYAIRKFQIEGDRSDDAAVAAPKNKVWSSFIPSSSCLCCKKVVVRHGIAKKIVDVKQKLDEVLMEKDRYGFAISQPKADLLHESWRDPSTSFTDLEEICGRDSDRDSLVTKLMDRQEVSGFQVVSIVGAGGLGKTTLAQLVYNNSRVVNYFNLRIWICVSDPFDLAAIAKSILESGGGASSSNNNNLDVLLKDVKEFISGKRFLLMLDDVWTEDSKKWDSLKTSLSCGGEGSKVLVTTRNERVAIVLGTIENDIYRPQLLSLDDCWSLLCRISLSRRSEDERQKFQDIGMKIAGKCDGLPLAACVLGSLLQFKSSLEEWESVFESEIWHLEEVEEQLFPHLLLSYNQLSPALKRCFSYCAIFPKDFEIDVDELIEKWIAQGYLGYDVGDMESKGQEYFQNLAMRSLFQDLERRDLDGKIMSCKMHDIVHDFAQSLRKDRSSVRVEAGMKMKTCHRCSSSLISTVKTYRSLVSFDQSYICDCLTSLRVLNTEQNMSHGIPQEMEHLIHLRWLDLSYNNISREAFKTICKIYNLQFLRLCGCKLEEVLREIGNLIQLRHLDLSRNFTLKELPAEIGNLIQLKHLDLSFNDSLTELCVEIGNLIQLRHLNLSYIRLLKKLPEEIGNLIQLRQLDLSHSDHLTQLPESICGCINLKHILNEGTHTDLFSEGLSKLSNLCKLTKFCGGKDAGKLGWLKNLNLLSGSLLLHILMGDDPKGVVEDEREADLRSKMYLGKLIIWWWFDDANDSVWMDLMNVVEPHPNLQNISLNMYGGSKLSEWITSPLFQLRSIHLQCFNRMQSLPPFGKLPCLEELEIDGFEELQLVGREFIGITRDIGVQSASDSATGFPKLKFLWFKYCRNWREWEDISVEEEDSNSITLMPHLEKLIINDCDCLTALPERLLRKKALSLENVRINSASTELVKCYKGREGASWESGGYYHTLVVPFGPK